MPQQDEREMLREESESLAAFLRMLQREYCHLQADFAAILHAAGGQIRVSAVDRRAAHATPRIERVEDPATGAVMFRLKEPTA